MILISFPSGLGDCFAFAFSNSLSMSHIYNLSFKGGLRQETYVYVTKKEKRIIHEVEMIL